MKDNKSLKKELEQEARSNKEAQERGSQLGGIMSPPPPPTQPPPEKPKSYEAIVTLVTPSDKKSESSFLKFFETFTTLIKAIAWPLVALLLFLTLRGHLNVLLDRIPSSQSTKIAVGSLSLEIQQAAQAAGNPQLAALIGDLSPKALETLLNTGKERYKSLVTYNLEDNILTIPDEKKFAVLEELQAKNLIKLTIQPDDYMNLLSRFGLKKRDYQFGTEGEVVFIGIRNLPNKQREKITPMGFELTSDGQRAFDLIIDSVVNLLKTPKDEKLGDKK